MPLCGTKEARLAAGGGTRPPREFFLHSHTPEVKGVFNSFSLQRPDLSKELATAKYKGRILGPYSYEGAIQPRPWLTEKDIKQPSPTFASRRPRVGEDWAGAFRPPSAELDFLNEPPRRLSALQPAGGMSAAPGAYGKKWPEAIEAPPPPRDLGLDVLSDAPYRPDGSIAEAAFSSGLNYTHSFRSSQPRLHPPPRLHEGQQQFLTIPPSVVDGIHVKDPKRISSTFRVGQSVRPMRSKYLPEPFGGAWTTPPPLPKRKKLRKKPTPSPSTDAADDDLIRSSSMPSLAPSASAGRLVPSWSFAPTRVSDRSFLGYSTEVLSSGPSYSEIYR